MKKLILIFFLFILSCGTPTIVLRPNYQTYELLDSILKAEHVLTYDSFPLQDYLTLKWFYTYYFIRDSLIIRWIYRGDSVQITKRINK